MILSFSVSSRILFEADETILLKSDEAIVLKILFLKAFESCTSWFREKLASPLSNFDNVDCAIPLLSESDCCVIYWESISCFIVLITFLLMLITELLSIFLLNLSVIRITSQNIIYYNNLRTIIFQVSIWYIIINGRISQYEYKIFLID